MMAFVCCLLAGVSNWLRGLIFYSLGEPISTYFVSTLLFRQHGVMDWHNRNYSHSWLMMETSIY